jgi:hypothetical protein
MTCCAVDFGLSQISPEARSVPRRLAIVGSLLIAALTWSPTVASTLAAEHVPRVTVEVDVYSGRPNPSWQLDAAQAHSLLRMLDDVQRSGRRRQPCVNPGLGYRGLTLRIVERAGTTNWRVFRHCLEHDGQAFDDAGARVQAFLLRSMPPSLKGDLAGVLRRSDR